MAATRRFISLRLVRAGCVLALELRPLSPLMPLAPLGEAPCPLASCAMSLEGVEPSSPLAASRVYWFLASRTLLAGGRPVLRFVVDRPEGGVSAFGLPLACAALEGETLGDGGGESDYISDISTCSNPRPHTFSSSALGSSIPLTGSFRSLCRLLLLLFVSNFLVSIGPRRRGSSRILVGSAMS